MFNHTIVIVAALSIGCAASVPAQSTKPSVPTSPSREIAPDANRAAEALKTSPRHGEWVDIEMPMAGSAKEFGGEPAKLHTWIVYPERSDKAPVALVIHEIFGLTDWVRAVADQLAAEGFIAVAPDLLSGMGPSGGGTEALGEKARDVIRTLTHEETARRLNIARDYALKLPSAGTSTACIGFCWGGSASFMYAAQEPALKAAVVYYGTAPSEKEVLARISCPVLGLYGGDDARVTSTVETTVNQMKEAGKAFEPHTYEGAGHGFLRQQDGKDGANLKAAQEAWAATLEFLKKHCP